MYFCTWCELQELLLLFFSFFFFGFRLRPCLDFFSPCFNSWFFYYFVSFFIGHAAFAWYLASHTQMPSFLMQLFHHLHPSFPLPLHPPPHPIHPKPHFPLTSLWQPPTPEQTAGSDRRGAWEVQPTRQANSSYLTSHLAADRHGGSVQVHTPYPFSQHPLPPPAPPTVSMKSDLSHKSKVFTLTM